MPHHLPRGSGRAGLPARQPHLLLGHMVGEGAGPIRLLACAPDKSVAWDRERLRRASGDEAETPRRPSQVQRAG
jgi:hypothetical protein